ncbi:MAG: hypothetical protein ABS75_31650 [Pelagibacterium sp. SCN 63-23]|nr:MAG: hypothetical protein ABS75_31650 [Pelagibacterium sp. SCN 63-23]
MPAISSPATLRLPLFIALAALVMGFPRTLVQTAGAGLFLAHFPAQWIAWIYLATALVCPLVATVFLRLESRLPLVPMLIGVQAASALVSVALSLFYRLEPQTVAALTFLWAQIENMTSSLVFWGLANQYFAIAQARREFARIGAGEQLGALGVGLTIPLALVLLQPSDLLLVSAASNLLAGALIIVILRRLAPAAGLAATPDLPLRPQPFNRRVKAFIAAIFAATLCSNLAFFLIDNSFYIETQAHFADGVAATGFIGMALASAAGVSLVLSNTLAPVIMSRFGVAAVIPLLPGALLVLTLAVLLAHSGMAGGLAWVFGLVVAMKVLDESLRLCLYRPASQALFQPLPASARFRAQTLSEGFVEPSGIALAACLLLLAGLLPDIGAADIAIVLAPVLAIWWIAGLIVGRRYRTALELAVTGRQTLDPAAPVFASPQAIALLVDRARSLDPSEAAPLLPIIRSRDVQAYRALLPDLLGRSHDLDKVILSHPQDFAGAGLAPQLAALLPRAEAGLQPMLLAALSASADPVALAAITTFEPQSRAGHLARARALIAMGGPEGGAATRAFIEGLEDPHPQIRCDALQVLADSRDQEVVEAIALRFGDPDATTRHLAYRIAAGHGAPILLDGLHERLSDPACPSQDLPPLLSAMGSFGAPGLDVLRRVTTSGDPALQRLCVTALARIDDPAAQACLADLALTADPAVALAAISKIWGRALLLPRRPARARAEILIDQAVHLTRAIAVLNRDDDMGLAIAALRHEARQRLDLALALVMICDPHLVGTRPAFASVMRFGSGDPGYADEHFELALPPRLRPAALLALGGAQDTGDSRRLAALASAVPDQPGKCLAWLQAGPIPLSAWSRLCLANLAPPGSKIGGTQSMDVLEKVMILKSVDLFAGIEDVYLAEFAPVVEELFLDPGQALIAAGSMGTTLYIVVNGSLGVERNGVEIARLGRFDVAGELAAFDPQPRSADVVAREASHVLALSQAHLETLIASHMDIATSIIQTLSRRLRKALGG